MARPTSLRPSAPHRRAGAVAVLAVVVVVTSACGVGTGKPTAIDDDDVPYGLLSPTLPTTTSTTTRSATRPVPVFLVREGRLVPAVRDIVEPASVRDAIDALRAGPSEEERQAGLRSALPAERAIRGVERDGDLATIALGEGFAEATSQEQTLALGQLVYTATSIPGVTRVAFMLGDRTIDVPRPDGTITPVVTREDFRTLLEQPPQ